MIFFGVSAMLFTYPIFTTLERRAAGPPSAWSWLPDHRHRLYVDQRHHQSRDVPGHIRALGVACPSPSPTPSSAARPNMSRLYLKDIGHERWFYIYISALAACR